jgi:hypothetical protein
MRRDWTPSIAPGGHDQTVYLVYGRMKPSCMLSCPGTVIPSASSPLTLQSAGPRTSRKTSHQKSSAGAIFSSAMCPPLPNTSLRAVKAVADN